MKRFYKTNSDDEDEENNQIVRVCPWKNVEEFKNVYNGLFALDSDQKTHKKSLDQMMVWKIRRMNWTPASVLSTIVIVEVQIKDALFFGKNDLTINDNKSNLSNGDLRILYSNAFTRFLNYMSSIMQTRQFKTMYNTIKELGLESFLVDIRHLCAHGHEMPTLDVFRNTSQYCLNWLKQYYWDREVNVIENVTIQDVRKESIINYEENLKKLLTLYDLVTEAMYNKCQFIDKCENIFNADAMKLLKEYSNNVKIYRLNEMLQNIVYEMSMLTSKQIKKRGNDRTFCDLLFRCKYFMNTSGKFNQSNAKLDSNENSQTCKLTKQMFILLHQDLFRSIVICGFIELFFKCLIVICENDYENDEQRNGASFWAQEILTGFLILKQFKEAYKRTIEKNKHVPTNSTPIVGMNEMPDEIKNIYDSLGINCSENLIFGDAIHRPWTLSFNNSYLIQRIRNNNKYTKDIVTKMLYLTNEPFTIHQISTVNKLLKVYTDEQNIYSGKNLNETNDDKIYTVQDKLENMKNVNVSHVSDDLDENSYGIWRKDFDHSNWKICPIGRFLWE